MKLGRISENVLKRSVLRQIRTGREEVLVGAGVGIDCAAVRGSACSDGRGGILLTCTQEGFLERGMVPVLQRAVNRLACRGAEPVSVSVSLLLPAEEQEERLKALMAEAESFCHVLGIQIAEAGGRVSDTVAEPYGTVTAIGFAREGDMSGDGDCFHTVKAAKPGQDIVVSKWIGLEGTAILAKRHRESLLERYPAWLVDEAAGFDRYLSTVSEAERAIRSGARALHNVSEGGIFAGLWELAEGAGTGFVADLKKLPIRQETVEVCNYCNRNPYELLSEGCLLMTCDDGEALASALEDGGVPAVVVGRLTEGRDRLIRNEDETRYLDRPHTDEIYK